MTSSTPFCRDLEFQMRTAIPTCACPIQVCPLKVVAVKGSFSSILWMDEILHHLRNPGMMIPLSILTNNGFPWSQSGAGFRPSIHSINSICSFAGISFSGSFPNSETFPRRPGTRAGGPGAGRARFRAGKARRGAWVFEPRAPRVVNRALESN